MHSTTPASTQASSGSDTRLIPVETLSGIVAGFNPQEIGLSRAWDEFYHACLAAEASPKLLQAIHDIKESIEDAEAEHGE